MAGKSVIQFTHKGNFNKLENFLSRAVHVKPLVRKILDKYGQRGVEALKEGAFVLEASNVTFPNGITRFVSSSTNYVQADNGDGIVQTAFTNFTYSPGPNGLGGVTVEGKISGFQLRQDKDGNYFCNYNIQGVAVSATISITLTGGTNQASVIISPNFNNNNMTMTGNIFPLNESDVFQGTTW